MFSSAGSEEVGPRPSADASRTVRPNTTAAPSCTTLGRPAELEEQALIGMDPADDPVYETPTPLRSMGANNQEATKELEIEIDASDEVEPLQTAPGPELPSAKIF